MSLVLIDGFDHTVVEVLGDTAQGLSGDNLVLPQEHSPTVVTISSRHPDTTILFVLGTRLEAM